MGETKALKYQGVPSPEESEILFQFPASEKYFKTERCCRRLLFDYLLAAGVHAGRAHFHAEVLARGQVLKLVHFAVLQMLAVSLAVLQ